MGDCLCCQNLGSSLLPGSWRIGRAGAAVMVCQNSLVLAADLLPELGCSGSAVPHLEHSAASFLVNCADIG